MRVNMLRVIAIALIFVLVDVDLFGYQVIPDVIGLVVLFFCSVLFSDKAGRFARTAVVAAVMLFLEAIRIFGLTGNELVMDVLGNFYVFLKVLLVITAADGVAQFCQLQGREDIAKRCDATGHIYALTFVFWVFSVWFEPLTGILRLLSLLVTVLTLVMFIYFYSATYVVVQEQYDAPPEAPDEDEESEDAEGDE
jgi:hypothetical protein